MQPKQFLQASDRSFRLLALVVTIMFGAPLTLAGAETSLTDLKHTTSKQLPIESTAPDQGARDSAAAALCDLYVVLKSDPRIEHSEMLQGQAAKVRRRLITIAKRRENQLTRGGIPKPAHLSQNIETVLKQASRNPLPENQSQPGELTGSLSRAQGGAAVLDNGWGLVELIQRVVAPDFWDARGGNGSIHYFAMRRLLVVRATSDVHQQIEDLLTALR